ncbi:MAG: carbohydrate ABC transporter permease [Bacillota bacterium]|nr:carbohydrate ABC transporter permease [Bacillota bacterium]
MGRQMSKMKLKKLTVFDFCNTIFFVLFCIVTLYPFWYTFLASVVSYTELLTTPILIWPSHVSLAVYKTLLTRASIMTGFKVSVSTTLLGTVLTTLASAITGYVLSRREVPGRNTMFTFVLIPMIFGGGLIPLYVTLNTYHLINSWWVYIWPGLMAPYYIIIFKTSFSGIPQSLVDSARIDGCPEWGILLRIIMPISLPILATIAVFTAVAKWNNYTTPLYFIRDASKFNLQLILRNMINTDRWAQDIVVAGDQAMVAEQLKYGTVIVATVPILVVYPFLQRYFVKGVLIGAIKS